MRTVHSREKLTLANELLYEIKVSEAMSREVIAFPMGSTFREIQLALKKNKISGVPIVDGDGNLAGIVSIDDVFTAFDKGYIDKGILAYMTRQVMTIPQNYSVVTAIRTFEKIGVGRLPVTETATSCKVVGIITMGDILNRLLVVVSSIAENVENAETETHLLAEANFEELKEHELRFEVRADDFDNAGKISSLVKANLKKSGVDPRTLRRIAIVCYEAEMNIIIHSLGGSITVKVGRDAVGIIARDRGPGIPDVEKALKLGYTTASEKIRALGFGAGMGLDNIRNCSDRMQLVSSMETGTRLEAYINLKGKDETQ
jgi:CBS domain-containing protein